MSENDIKTEIELIKQNCYSCGEKITKAIDRLEKKVDLLIDQNHQQDLRIQKLEGDKTGVAAIVTALIAGIFAIGKYFR